MVRVIFHFFSPYVHSLVQFRTHGTVSEAHPTWKEAKKVSRANGENAGREAGKSCCLLIGSDHFLIESKYRG